MSDYAATPEPPYYAVIFTSTRTEGDWGYGETAALLEELAREVPGFLGMESARGADGFGITVCYWATEAAIEEWKCHIDHQAAQARGRREWYKRYEIRVARVDRAYAGPARRGALRTRAARSAS
ncbi:MAG: antibiotic biosynthesis monooxygenase [Bryobacteraceae bacterium]|jgi:heme-degrading monooxygenase HmoA